jgi:hypothetical protein
MHPTGNVAFRACRAASVQEAASGLYKCRSIATGILCHLNGGTVADRRDGRYCVPVLCMRYGHGLNCFACAIDNRNRRDGARR